MAHTQVKRSIVTAKATGKAPQPIQIVRGRCLILSPKLILNGYLLKKEIIMFLE